MDKAIIEAVEKYMEQEGAKMTGYWANHPSRHSYKTGEFIGNVLLSRTDEATGKKMRIGKKDQEINGTWVLIQTVDGLMPDKMDAKEIIALCHGEMRGNLTTHRTSMIYDGDAIDVMATVVIAHRRVAEMVGEKFEQDPKKYIKHWLSSPDKDMRILGSSAGVAWLAGQKTPKTPKVAKR